VLEFQRTRFALLPNPKVNTVSSSNCPSEDDLRTLAAGLCSDPLSAELTTHAAACGHCGPLLREYQEDFSDDVTPEEQTALAQLRSTSPEWQQEKAREMLKPVSTTVPRPSPRWTLSWRWAMIPAATAACAAIAVSIWYTQRETPGKVDTLLAQVYTDKRTTEMRLPNAKHADFVQTRSGEAESRLNSPPSLSRAAEQISEHLKKDPDDPKWLILSARLDLLDWNYKPALSSLERINDAHVAESPEFLMTRAFALYERSEVLKENQGYFEAVNLLGKALQKTPDDPVLLFNQAIACEKIHAYECAQGDWTRFLTLEKDPGWASEGRKHLRQIEEKKTLAP
jgi:hypothetical protein